MTSLNKYSFNAYDTVVALALTQYLKTLPQPRTVLRRIVDPKVIRLDGGAGVPLKTDVDGVALAELLNRAMEWMKRGLPEGTNEPLEADLVEGLSAATTCFSGQSYVQRMDAGFAEFLWDLYKS